MQITPHRIFITTVYAIVLYLLIQFTRTFYHDVSLLFQQEHLKNLSLLQNCQLQYKQNYCDPKKRVPELFELCHELTVCIDKYKKLSNSQLTLKTELMVKHFVKLVEIATSQLSYKTLLVMLFSVLVIIALQQMLILKGYRDTVASRAFQDLVSSVDKLRTPTTTATTGSSRSSVYQSSGERENNGRTGSYESIMIVEEVL